MRLVLKTENKKLPLIRQRKSDIRTVIPKAKRNMTEIRIG